MQILFVSAKSVIGVGFDCKPMIFTADETGLWSSVKFLDERKTVASSSRYGSQACRGSFQFCDYSCIIPLRKPGDALVKRFGTSGLDGKVVIWELDNNINIPQ